MTPFCAAVDWGTSSFRIWLLSADGHILDERRSDEGMSRAREIGFDAVLESHLAALGAEAALPVIICGMAGARQGWREAGYIDTPADLARIIGNALVIDGYKRDVRILPGIAQRDPDAPDVMRGEETQLLGLASDDIRSGLVCMPGTHSKWVTLEGGKVARFSTYMTGELFTVVSAHSILRMAIEGNSEVAPGDPAFLAAVKTAYAAPETISKLLFSIRSSQLLGFSPQSEGVARLSGLLIGLEFAGAIGRTAPPRDVVLVGSGRLGALYRSALMGMGLPVRYCEADEAVRRGLMSAARAFWSADGGRDG
jgi:2-dehydro-3-deoxygalactonokinase